MSVLLETSLGDIVIDLLVKDCPKASQNFLKLCKAKFYNNVVFDKIEKDYLAFFGASTGKQQNENCSAWNYILGNEKHAKKFFHDEIHKDIVHDAKGILAMATESPDSNGNRVYLTLREDLERLDGAHTIFGRIAEEEGLEVLDKVNQVMVDHYKRPFQNVRIKHVIVLDDPFDDIADEDGYESPAEILDKQIEDLLQEENEDAEAQLDRIRKADAKSQAITLELLNDLPDADMKPPDNVLFIANLNPVTQDSDLQLLFERFGLIRSCQIIRDFKTGDSLQYAFIEYEAERDCEEAFFKMQGVLVDGRRIHCDFSQSVSKQFSQFKSGRISADEIAGMKGGKGLPSGGNSSENYKLDNPFLALNGKKGKGKKGKGKDDFFGFGKDRASDNPNAIPIPSSSSRQYLHPDDAAQHPSSRDGGSSRRDRDHNPRDIRDRDRDREYSRRSRSRSRDRGREAKSKKHNKSRSRSRKRKKSRSKSRDKKEKKHEKKRK
ncbi:unnamed protein product [Amoebophrya sp. A120]|nr:unnamed protein product [Amoebophrya sp. A120]|eukprot:GSA120T00007088001.1